MNPAATFCTALGIEVPLICSAMYPCSKPELVAAVSTAGGRGRQGVCSSAEIKGSVTKHTDSHLSPTALGQQ
jgi:NAD(P)H-dependent flavin oxidoreductase YrpB (nitropropane dioxygenase family)